MARLRSESAAGGRWILATRAGGPSALRLLLLLGAVLKPQESVAQLLTTPGSLESAAVRKPQKSEAQLLTTPGSLESEVPTGKTLEEYGERIEACWQLYTNYMDSVKGDWCDWAIISRPYSDLQDCLEHNADLFHLGFPNPMAEQFILETHQVHFANCSLVQPTLSDPPEDVLLAMIIAPICLIPFLVTLVVWRSKDNETQA